MKKLRYSVAASLDGFIAGPRGEYDWIVMDPDFDWKALYGQFDTLIIGRKTYETMRARGMSSASMGMKAYVVSRTLDPRDHPDVTVMSGDVPARIRLLKGGSGKHMWLCGGATLFRYLLDAGLVDAIDVTVVPVLLGGGVPLVPEGRRCVLKLSQCEARRSGLVMLKYDVADLPLPGGK